MHFNEYERLCCFVFMLFCFNVVLFVGVWLGRGLGICNKGIFLKSVSLTLGRVPLEVLVNLIHGKQAVKFMQVQTWSFLKDRY